MKSVPEEVPLCILRLCEVSSQKSVDPEFIGAEGSLCRGSGYASLLEWVLRRTATVGGVRLQPEHNCRGESARVRGHVAAITMIGLSITTWLGAECPAAKRVRSPDPPRGWLPFRERQKSGISGTVRGGVARRALQ